MRSGRAQSFDTSNYCWAHAKDMAEAWRAFVLQRETISIAVAEDKRR